MSKPQEYIIALIGGFREGIRTGVTVVDIVLWTVIKALFWITMLYVVIFWAQAVTGWVTDDALFIWNDLRPMLMDLMPSAEAAVDLMPGDGPTDGSDVPSAWPDGSGKAS